MRFAGTTVIVTKGKSLAVHLAPFFASKPLPRIEAHDTREFIADFAGLAPGARSARDQPPGIGEGGICVSPVISGMRIITSSGKQNDQSSPGWIERIRGC